MIDGEYQPEVAAGAIALDSGDALSIRECKGLTILVHTHGPVTTRILLTDHEACLLHTILAHSLQRRGKEIV